MCNQVFTFSPAQQLTLQVGRGGGAHKGRGAVQSECTRVGLVKGSKTGAQTRPDGCLLFVIGRMLPGYCLASAARKLECWVVAIAMSVMGLQAFTLPSADGMWEGRFAGAAFH